MTPTVAVLGCGPAGLAAAHAVHVAGCTVHVYSKPRKSELHGAQYLHHPIPGMTSTAPRTVTVDLIGSHEDYRRRVYGGQADSVPVVSTEDLPPEHDAWDIRSTYDNLWDAYSPRIIGGLIQPTWLRHMLAGTSYDVVFSTVPAPVLCTTDEHVFNARLVRALGDAVGRGEARASALVNVADEHVLCNGNGAASWYRAARVFGHTTVEWPMPQTLEEDMGLLEIGAVSVLKPLETDCDCFPEVTRLGRYGQWKKGVLVHHAYEEALDVCLAL